MLQPEKIGLQLAEVSSPAADNHYFREAGVEARYEQMIVSAPIAAMLRSNRPSQGHSIQPNKSEVKANEQKSHCIGQHPHA
ncbi:hypothetical protein PAT3040_03655 [Paenibacillus agaridevorans]|uniref:Uncharacterized protein n=1 Tax=Paenibacillus agaridevorans TaxID=171404 RepID=A0A2R5EYZ2_9BACL|nr:hypothetical protein PAT3040_03655 [Paenibacillus agaridevorans]